MKRQASGALLLMAIGVVAASVVVLPVCASSPPTLFPIEKHGKWGYIDATGKAALEPR